MIIRTSILAAVIVGMLAFGASSAFRRVGSRSAHEALNARMKSMLGSENSDRMHEAIGRRLRQLRHR